MRLVLSYSHLLVRRREITEVKSVSHTVSKQRSQDLNCRHKSRDVMVTCRHLISLNYSFFFFFIEGMNLYLKSKDRLEIPVRSDSDRFWETFEVYREKS